MAAYVTREDIEAMGIKWKIDGERKVVPRDVDQRPGSPWWREHREAYDRFMGRAPSLHPEADARLAAATGRTAVSVGSAAIDRVLNSAPWQAMLATPPTTYSAPSTPGNASGHAFASGHDLAGGPPAPAKPSALAAGQVWRVPFYSPNAFTLARQRVAELGSPWETEEGGLWSVRAILDGGEYLGTREEVVAREREAHPLRTVMAPPRAPVIRINGHAVPHATVDTQDPNRPSIHARLTFAEDDALHAAVKNSGAEVTVEIDGVSRQGVITVWVAKPILDEHDVPVCGEVTIVITWADFHAASKARVAHFRAALEAPPPSPLAVLRAEIDRLIAADAGPFAAARAAALRCYSEPHPGPRDHNPDRLQKARAESAWMKPAPGPRDAGRLFAALLRYETARGGARTPAAAAQREADLIEPHVLATYERERSRSDVYARGSR